MPVRFGYWNAAHPKREDAISILQSASQESNMFVACTWFSGLSTGQHSGGKGYKDQSLLSLANQIREYITERHDKCEGRVLAMGAHETGTSRNESCLSIDLIQLDCDNGGIALSQMVDLIRSLGLRAIVYPSPSEKSSVMEARRFRVLLQCVRFIPDPTDYVFEKAWADRFHAVRICFEAALDCKIDPKTDRLATLAYVHPAHAPRDPSDVIYIDGKIVDAQGVAEELRSRAIWNTSDDMSEPENKTLDIDTGKQLLDILDRNGYLLGPSDGKGWIPTKCPRELWHTNGMGTVGSTAIEKETGLWVCHHTHSRCPDGPVRGSPYHLIKWLSDDLPHEWAAGGLELSFAVRRVQARLRANAAAMAAPLPLARVQADVIELTDEVCKDYIEGLDGILGIHAGTVGGGKSHAVPELVKIAQRKCQIESDGKTPAAVVSVRDRKAVKETYERLKSAGLRVVQQQSIDSVRDSQNRHICIYAKEALQLTSEGIDARDVLCKGGLIGNPCKNSKVHGDASSLCPAELGFAGDSEVDVVLCTHAGTPGLDKFIQDGTMFIQDEHESGALKYSPLWDVTIRLAQRRANYLRDEARSRTLVGICERLKNNPNLLGTPVEERDIVCFEMLREWAMPEPEGLGQGRDSWPLWDELALQMRPEIIEWKKACHGIQSDYLRRCKAWENAGKKGMSPPSPKIPTKPSFLVQPHEALWAAISNAKLGGRGTLNEMAEARWRDTGELPGGTGAGNALEGIVRWMNGSRAVKCADKKGNEIDGHWLVQWYGNSTSMVQKHVMDKKGPAVVLDATADEQWWVGASSRDRVKYRRVQVEDMARVKRVVIATYQARMKYIVYDDNVVKWSGLDPMIVELCKEIYTYNQKGGLKIAAIARRPIALTLYAFWKGLTAREVLTDKEMIALCDEPMLNAVSKSIATMTRVGYANLSTLRALYSDIRWTWYGSTISVGSNELASCDIYLSLGDPLPPPEVAEANATVSGRTAVESAAWIAGSLVEQWFGRARAVRRKDTPLLMVHIGACVAQSWLSAEIRGLQHGGATIVKPQASYESASKNDPPKELKPKIKNKELPAVKALNQLDSARLVQHVYHELGSDAAVIADFAAVCGKEYDRSTIRNWSYGNSQMTEENFILMATMYADLVKKPSRWAELGAQIAGLTQGRSYKAVAAGMKKIAAFRGFPCTWITDKMIMRCVGGTGLSDEQWNTLKAVFPSYEKMHPGGSVPRVVEPIRSAKSALEGQPIHLLEEVAKKVYGNDVAYAYPMFKMLNDKYFESTLMTPWIETDIHCCDGFLVKESSLIDVGHAIAHQYAGDVVAPGLDKHTSMKYREALKMMDIGNV